MLVRGSRWLQRSRSVWIAALAALLSASLGGGATRSAASLRGVASEPAAALRAPGTGATAGVFAGSNLLLITVDTLRADVVGAYGGRGDLTPVIDHGEIQAHWGQGVVGHPADVIFGGLCDPQELFLRQAR